VQAAYLRATAAAGALAASGQTLQALVDAKVTDPAQLGAALDAVAAFGVAVPLVANERLAAGAGLVAAETARRVIDANEQLKIVSIDAVQAAGQTIFGEGFWILGEIADSGAIDAWDSAFAAVPDGAGAAPLRRFVTDQASVRDGVRRLLEAQLLAGGGGRAIAARRTNGRRQRQSTATLDCTSLAAGEPTPTASVVSTVVAASNAFDAGAPLAALVVDQWIGVLPVRETRGEGAAALVNARHTSGIAFNANAPGARAPQVLLVAVSPDGARWNVDSVLGVLQETLELARLRLVTLERTNGIARVLPALYEQSWSLRASRAQSSLHGQDLADG
jgi:hypothetical protein